MSTSIVTQFPPELLFNICAAVYDAGVPAANPSLDPVLIDQPEAPTALPSSYPSSHWPESVARRTLSNLCLVNHAWSEAAKPWLWHRVEVRLPQSWMAFVEEIAGDEEVTEENVDQSIRHAATAALALKSPEILSDEEAKRLHDSIVASLSSPDSSIPPELLSPPASREPSPRRLRAKSKSPARWKIMRSINDALQNVMEQDGAGFYVPTPVDPHPGKYVRHIDFNHFRTIGMRRSVGEGIERRFVTGERLENILKECPNLLAFGATEYMDGALSLSVLKELFLRGSPSRGRGRSSRGRSITLDFGDDAEDMDRERRRDCKELVAVDLTGCVSAIFYNALRDFVNTYISVEDSDSSGDESTRDQARFRRDSKEPLTFPGLQRLCLLGVRSIQPDILQPFVLAFPSLTHLDLSCTRVTPELLELLGASQTVRLESLAIARCVKLTGEAITDFLVHGSAVQGLKQLNIYGDATFPSNLTEEQVTKLFTEAPCFKSGSLEYLDLSSSPITASHLSALGPQPKLRSLGLSYIPLLPLKDIAEFLRLKATNVEVLSLISTTPELTARATGCKTTMALHSTLIQPLCVPPFSFHFSLSLSGSATPAEEEAVPEPATHLRVVELALPLLNSLGAGAGTWKIVRSKGGRGWYVDTASGWVADRGEGPVLRRALPHDHPLRVELEKLAAANGNVSSGVGWHARKMEVLYGLGLLGREDGLYGAVSFAYQG